MLVALVACAGDARPDRGVGPTLRNHKARKKKKAAGRSRVGDTVKYRGKRVCGMAAFPYSAPVLLFFFVNCRVVRDRLLGRPGRPKTNRIELFAIFEALL